MNHIHKHRLILVIGYLLLLLTPISIPLVAQDTLDTSATTSADIIWFADQTIVETAVSTLTRTEHGIYMTFDTVDLTPDNAYTAWWVIFNQPENCSDKNCNPNDVFLFDQEGNPILDADGNQRPNRTGRMASHISLLRASHGLVDEDGSLHMRAHLPVGDTLEAVWGPGLVDPVEAHIHVAIRSHGPAIPGQLQEQFFTPWGGCPDSPPRDPCIDVVQVAVHIPAHHH